MKGRLVTVFGGSGFVGRHIVRRLVARGAIVRVAVRDPEAAAYLKPFGELGQVVPVPADVADPATVRAAVQGAHAVINLVGILFEKGRRSFERLHVEGAANVARAAGEAGVSSLVHVSAIGADTESPAAYARSKKQAEDAVLAAFPDATILRPSVIFGLEDDFFNRFAGLSRWVWVLPVFGCPTLPKVRFADGDISLDFYGAGGTRMQPVFVGDVAEAAVRALEQPGARGAVFELGGPKVYSYVELMRLLLANIGRRRLLVPVPFALMAITAWFAEWLPKPFITRDQLKLLKTDNVVGEGARTLADLGIEATPAEAVLPTYLARFKLPAGQRLRPAQ